MDLTDKEYYAKGRRGIVYTAKHENEKVLIKEHNPAADIDTLANEAEMLKRLNPLGIGPKFIAYEDGKLIREFIEGTEFLDWAQDKPTEDIKKLLLDVLEQCRIMDEANISKEEMTRPYKHILIRKNKPIQIDFERARETEKPQNVTQLCQWLTSTRLTVFLKEKSININKEKLILLAKEYKKSYNHESYEKIRGVLK
ncbi:hypothetical protein GOV11_01625 [Candidatus Woesearchaeota archaeon]|nr:hypothetical protein [Candidatus Woesearchaeota archaeon]